MFGEFFEKNLQKSFERVKTHFQILQQSKILHNLYLTSGDFFVVFFQKKKKNLCTIHVVAFFGCNTSAKRKKKKENTAYKMDGV